MEEKDDLLTLSELTARVGISVRNVRFYTTRGLIPPPLRRGRTGYYNPDHVARLELLQELQAGGYTLAAIEGFMASVPEGASPEDIALLRTTLLPWDADPAHELTRGELEERVGHRLTKNDLATLEALGICRRAGRDRFVVSTTLLGIGMALVENGFPAEAGHKAAEIYRRHGQALAEELDEFFRAEVWPAFAERGVDGERAAEIVERLKPLSIASLVSAYEAALAAKRRG